VRVQAKHLRERGGGCMRGMKYSKILPSRTDSSSNGKWRWRI